MVHDAAVSVALFARLGHHAAARRSARALRASPAGIAPRPPKPVESFALEFGQGDGPARPATTIHG